MHRRNIFIGALEQRLNIVLFRMRILPTIFSSTQFIRHQGILVNDILISLPSFRVKIGEVISISPDQ
jgi:small subunit ribosomal protein S4